MGLPGLRMVNGDMRRIQNALAAGGITLLGLVFWALSGSDGQPLGWSNLIAHTFVGALVVLMTIDLQRLDGRLQIGLSRPAALFAIFYALYYLIPHLIVTLQGGWEENDDMVTAGLILLGYSAWMIGSRLGGNNPTLTQCARFSVSRNGALGLLAICVLGVVGVAYGFAWRISEGIFFNQARYFEQAATVVDSFRFVFLAQIQLPIILLLGMLSAGRFLEVKAIAGTLLLTYGAGLSVLLIMSSQTRPAVSAALFTVLALKFGASDSVGMRRLLAVAAVGAFGIVVVQSLRTSAKDDFAGAENQLIFALKNAFSKTSETIGDAESRRAAESAVLTRASGGVQFLSEIWREVEARGGPLYGKGIAQGLPSLIPRIAWPDKPATVPPQIVAQELLGFPITYDASLGPVTQFYLEGGWPGVFGGFVLLGWFVAWLTRNALAKGQIGWWLALSFTWGHISNLEMEVGLGLATALRSAVAAYLLWLVAVGLVRLLPQKRSET